MNFEIEVPIYNGQHARELNHWLCKNVGIMEVDWDINFHFKTSRFIIKCKEPDSLVMIGLRWA